MGLVAESVITKHKCPLGVSATAWAAACALAADRHPNADYPQPRDVSDAQIAAAAIHKFEEQFYVWR